MAFQIKDFASIAASMLNWMRSSQSKVTDFNVGGVARTMLEATAVEIEEQYLRLFIGLREAIPVSVYNTFGFNKLPAASASGTIRFATGSPAVAPIPIQAGTAVRAPGKTLTYVTLADAQINIGATYADVLAAADTPGVIGNSGANTITELAGSLSGITAVNNQAPIINGRDEETDDERLTRFRGYISSLARGTISAVLYGAKTVALKDAQGQTVEYVALAALEEPWLTNPAQPVALVNLYIHNGAGATSASLVTETQKVIDGYYADDGSPVPGWKAAGVMVDVAAATDQSVNITATVDVDSSYTPSVVLDDAEAALRLYIQGLTVGGPVLKSELIAIIKRDVPGVINVTVTVPAADVTVPISAKAVPGTISLTAV